MSKLSYKTLFTILFFLLIGVVILSRFILPKQKVSAAWWNEGWMYRKAVSVTNTSGSTLSNQRVKIIVDTSALVTAGKLQSDCDDIRITDINGNLLDHWDTDCNSTTTNIYFKLNSIPTSGTSIYLYYGNSSANSTEKTLGNIDNPGTSCEMMKNQGSVTTSGTYYVVPGGNDSDKQFVYCDQTTDGGGWTLVMNQKSDTGGFFANSTEAQSYNEANPTADRYSILGKLSKFKDSGIFTFKINWPTLNSSRNIWSQTSNPINETIAGYTAITIDHTENAWGGIAPEGGSATFIDGSPGSAGYWFYAIASYNSYGIGIPSYSPDVTQTQLWIKGNNTMNNVSIGTPASEELSPAPIAYWKFDEGSGTTTYSSSGTNNGTLLGSTLPTWQNEDQCISGKCLNFSGGTNTAVYTNNLNWNILKQGQEDKSWTLSVWAKPSGIQDGSERVILGRSGCHGGIYASSDSFRFAIKTDSCWTNAKEITYTPPNMTDWYFLTAVYNNRNMTFYVNGKSVGSTTFDATIFNYSDTIYIGGIGALAFKGLIDETKIYPYARTADQIKQDYNSRGSSKGSSVNLGVKSNTSPTLNSKLVAYYKFDEGNGNKIYDSIGNTGLTGTLYSSISWAPKNECKSNSCLYVSDLGTSNFTTARIPDSNLLSNLSQITVSTWIKTVSTKNTQQIIYKRQNGGIPNWHSFQLTLNNLKPSFIVSDTGGTSTSITSTNTIETNKWYHIVGIYNGSQLKLFINGRSSASPVSKNGTILDSDGELLIGGLDTSNIYYFNGYIDNTKIYNTALTDEEIKQDYNQSAAAQFGTTNQTIGGTTTSLEYCIPGDTSSCALPIAEWNFEENTGTSAKDISGNNNTGTINNPNWVPGPKSKGSALSFNGTNSYINAGTNPVFNFGTGDFTVEFWLNYRGSTVVNNTYGLLVSRETGTGSSNPGFTSGISTWGGNGSNYGILFSTTNDAWGTGNVEHAGAYLPNTWYHIVGVRSGNTFTVYKNGQYGTSRTAVGIGADVTNSQILRIGGGSPWGYTNGSMDHVKIYNYARTPAQIAYDYNKGAPVAHWKLDECQGLTAFDSSGSGYTGTISIGPSGNQNTAGTCQVGTSAAWTNGASGKINSSLSFDGTDDYINTSNLLSSNTFSVSTWIYHNTYTQSGDAILGNSSWSSWFTKGFVMRFWGSNTSLNLILGNSTSDTITTISVPLQTWTHITMTYDGSNFKIYKNGQLVDTKTGINYAPSTNNLRIGSDYTNSGSVNYNGQIDDVRIYNYALTPDQVKNTYNNGAVNFQ